MLVVGHAALSSEDRLARDVGAFEIDEKHIKPAQPGDASGLGDDGEFGHARHALFKVFVDHFLHAFDASTKAIDVVSDEQAATVVEYNVAEEEDPAALERVCEQ